ncbi:MAG: linked oxidase domain protein [Frankiales bacterium]|nr:linked oxidase domain protein [Frankiales bacterium]
MTVTSIESLQAIVGAEHVLTDPDLKASYETDWTGRFTGMAAAVVRPGTTEQVAAVLRACSSAGVHVVLQGGNTGLVGGGVPAGGEVLISLTRLNQVGPVEAGQVTVGAGVTLAALQAHALVEGMDFGVDLAARDSCTIGGMIATNAGGIRVLRYGSMRRQLVGIEAVLADGSVLSRMPGLDKDGTGYDLVGLLAGSEGTLAVITQARLRLWPRPTSRAVALLAAESVEAVVGMLPALRGGLPSLAAVEFFLPAGLHLVRQHAGLPAPFSADHPAYLLVECTDRVDPLDQLAAVVEELPGLVDATVATDAAGQRALWAYREKHTESISAEGVPIKLDVSLPLMLLASFIAQVGPTIEAVCPGARPVLFGHVNEGNVHVNILDTGDRHDEVTDAVLRLVASLHGSISSEHGVGRAKVPWLGLTRSPVEIAAMRAVKNALDPTGLLNPGVILSS